MTKLGSDEVFRKFKFKNEFKFQKLGVEGKAGRIPARYPKSTALSTAKSTWLGGSFPAWPPFLHASKFKFPENFFGP